MNKETILLHFVQSPPRIYYPDISSVQFSVGNDRLENLPLNNLITEVGKAGFDLSAEYNRRFRLQDLFGKEQGDLMWIEGVTDEVVEHALEYSKKDIVRAPPAYELIEGKLFSPRFAAFADSGNITNGYERNGSVVRGIKKVQELLTKLDNGYVVWTSPDGPLGIGNLEYDYSWTNVFWKEKKGERTIVHYVCIRSDFTLSEHADFLNTFLKPSEYIKKEQLTNRMQGIQEILETPVIASGKNGVNNLPDIAKTMEIAVGGESKKIYTDKENGQSRFFSEVVSELSAIDFKQPAERKTIQKIIEHFENLIYNSKTKEEVLKHMAYYVLTLNYYYRTNLTSKEGVTYEDIFRIVGTIQNGYSQVLLDNLQQVKGCAGGIVRQNTSTFTKDIEPFTCPKCGYTTFERIGNQCPGCGLTKEEYVKELKNKGEQVCD